MEFLFLCKILKKLLFANTGELNQTPRFAASDLVLHCLPMSHKKDARLIWVNVPPTAKVIWRRVHSLVSSDRLEKPGIEPRNPGYKVGGLSTTPWWLFSCICMF